MLAYTPAGEILKGLFITIGTVKNPIKGISKMELDL